MLLKLIGFIIVFSCPLFASVQKEGINSQLLENSIPSNGQVSHYKAPRWLNRHHKKTEVWIKHREHWNQISKSISRTLPDHLSDPLISSQKLILKEYEQKFQNTPKIRNRLKKSEAWLNNKILEKKFTLADCLLHNLYLCQCAFPDLWNNEDMISFGPIMSDFEALYKTGKFPKEEYTDPFSNHFLSLIFQSRSDMWIAPLHYTKTTKLPGPEVFVKGFINGIHIISCFPDYSPLHEFNKVTGLEVAFHDLDHFSLIQNLSKENLQQFQWICKKIYNAENRNERESVMKISMLFALTHEYIPKLPSISAKNKRLWFQEFEKEALQELTNTYYPPLPSDRFESILSSQKAHFYFFKSFKLPYVYPVPNNLSKIDINQENYTLLRKNYLKLYGWFFDRYRGIFSNSI